MRIFLIIGIVAIFTYNHAIFAKTYSSDIHLRVKKAVRIYNTHSDRPIELVNKLSKKDNEFLIGIAKKLKVKKLHKIHKIGNWNYKIPHEKFSITFTQNMITDGQIKLDDKTIVVKGKKVEQIYNDIYSNLKGDKTKDEIKKLISGVSTFTIGALMATNLFKKK